MILGQYIFLFTVPSRCTNQIFPLKIFVLCELLIVGIIRSFSV